MVVGQPGYPDSGVAVVIGTTVDRPRDADRYNPTAGHGNALAQVFAMAAPVIPQRAPYPYEYERLPNFYVWDQLEDWARRNPGYAGDIQAFIRRWRGGQEFIERGIRNFVKQSPDWRIDDLVEFLKNYTWQEQYDHFVRIAR